MEDNTIVSWVIDFQDEKKHLDEFDYIGDADIKSRPKPPKNFYDDRIVYNQREVDDYSCVPVSIMWELSDQTGVRRSYDVLRDVLQYIRDRWEFTDWLGMNVGTGYRLVNHYLQENWGVPWYDNYTLSYHIVSLWSDLFYELLDKWYTIGVTYRGNWAYNGDRDDNAILDNIKFWNATYWHKLAVIQDEEDDEYVVIKDNYDYRRTNLYRIPKDNLQGLIDNWVFFENTRVWKMTEKDDPTISILGQTFKEEVSDPIFKSHKWDKPMTESDIRYLIEIYWSRLEKRLVSKIKELLNK